MLRQAGATHAGVPELQARLLGFLLLCANLAQRTTGGALSGRAHAPGGTADASAEDALFRCVDVFMNTHLALSSQLQPPAAAEAFATPAASRGASPEPDAEDGAESDEYEVRPCALRAFAKHAD